MAECIGVLAAEVNRSLVCALDPCGKDICRVIWIVALNRFTLIVRRPQRSTTASNIALQSSKRRDRAKWSPRQLPPRRSQRTPPRTWICHVPRMRDCSIDEASSSLPRECTVLRGAPLLPLYNHRSATCTLEPRFQSSSL